MVWSFCCWREVKINRFESISISMEVWGLTPTAPRSKSVGALHRRMNYSFRTYEVKGGVYF